MDERNDERQVPGSPHMTLQQTFASFAADLQALACKVLLGNQNDSVVETQSAETTSLVDSTDVSSPLRNTRSIPSNCDSLMTETPLDAPKSLIQVVAALPSPDVRFGIENIFIASDDEDDDVTTNENYASDGDDGGIGSDKNYTSDGDDDGYDHNNVAADENFANDGDNDNLLTAGHMTSDSPLREVVTVSNNGSGRNHSVSAPCKWTPKETEWLRECSKEARKNDVGSTNRKAIKEKFKEKYQTKTDKQV
jgi:hypothetical protein